MIEAERVALRRRYAQERDKRLRPDGNDQYLELTGRFSCLLNDPYTPRTERDPKRDHVTVAFVGGGFAGLVTGARLQEAGVRDVRIVEKGGGTWYWTSFLTDCTPGYYNNEGQFDGRQFPLGGGYHKGAPAYFRYIRQWRQSGDFAGLEFSRK